MKIKFERKHNRFIAIAEDAKDIAKMLSWNKGHNEEETEVPVRVVRKHRKHQFEKACPECGKLFRGNVGLGRHLSVAHDQKSIKHGYYKAWKEKQARKPEFTVETIEAQLV